MSVLIKGLEMPNEGAERCIVIRGDGTIRTFTGALIDYATAIPVPLHGRLKDADAFESIKYELPDGQKTFNRGFHSGVQYVQRLIMDAPTIIEAEGEE